MLAAALPVAIGVAHSVHPHAEASALHQLLQMPVCTQQGNHH